MFNVNANLFRLAALYQSTEETRFYICGVHLERHPKGGVLLVATDGSVMFVAIDPDGLCDDPVTVRLDTAALAACKAGRAEQRDRRLIGKDLKEALLIQTATFANAAAPLNWVVEGNFPDWRRVLPRRSDEPDMPKAEIPAFDARAINVLTKTATELAGRGSASVFRVEGVTAGLAKAAALSTPEARHADQAARAGQRARDTCGDGRAGRRGEGRRRLRGHQALDRLQAARPRPGRRILVRACLPDRGAFRRAGPGAAPRDAGRRHLSADAQDRREPVRRPHRRVAAAYRPGDARHHRSALARNRMAAAT